MQVLNVIMDGILPVYTHLPGLSDDYSSTHFPNDEGNTNFVVGGNSQNSLLDSVGGPTSATNDMVGDSLTDGNGSDEDNVSSIGSSRGLMLSRGWSEIDVTMVGTIPGASTRAHTSYWSTPRQQNYSSWLTVTKMTPNEQLW